MEKYIHLTDFDDLVGNTWFIGVELITLIFYTLPELLVIYQACHHCTVYLVLTLENYLLDALTVCNNIGSIYVLGDLQKICTKTPLRLMVDMSF